eukprot:scaffold6767_cov134-Alexandrium_tamarense.AAC.3
MCTSVVWVQRYTITAASVTKGTKKKPVDPKVENRIALVSVTINAADWMGILLRDAIVEKLQVETMKLLGRVDRGKRAKCFVDWQKRGTAMRDVWRAKKTGSALPSFTGQGFSGRSSNQMHNSRTSRGGGGTSASSSHDCKTFFRALACAALDILSRSLRRKSFVRVASALMGVQFI